MDIVQVYENYYQYIYHYALKLTCHPEDAMDLAQETFLKATKGKDTLISENAISSWLRTICFHEFLNMAKKREDKYLLDIEDICELEAEYNRRSFDTNTPEEEVIVAEEVLDMQNGCFYAMVRKLSLNQRIIFSIVDMYGMNTAEAAKLLDISENAAKALLHRARMNIDAFFSDHCGLIKEKNPCSCQAWKNFSVERAENQKQMRKLLDRLDYRNTGYTFDKKTRARVKYLYAHMPEWNPTDSWFQKVKKILQDA
jgi:RNA polymerase sigma factor (sigma-70 family)